MKKVFFDYQKPQEFVSVLETNAMDHYYGVVSKDGPKLILTLANDKSGYVLLDPAKQFRVCVDLTEYGCSTKDALIAFNEIFSHAEAFQFSGYRELLRWILDLE
jgi:hypothetical protein